MCDKRVRFNLSKVLVLLIFVSKGMSEQLYMRTQLLTNKLKQTNLLQGSNILKKCSFKLMYRTLSCYKLNIRRVEKFLKKH